VKPSYFVFIILLPGSRRDLPVASCRLLSLRKRQVNDVKLYNDEVFFRLADKYARGRESCVDSTYAVRYVVIIGLNLHDR